MVGSYDWDSRRSEGFEKDTQEINEQKKKKSKLQWNGSAHKVVGRVRNLKQWMDLTKTTKVRIPILKRSNLYDHLNILLGDEPEYVITD